MRHIIFKEANDGIYKVAILIKETSFTKSNLQKHYITPLVDSGIAEDSILGFSLTYNDQGKIPVSLITDSLNTILPACRSVGVTILLVADVAYFKKLTGQSKAETHYGYVLPCTVKNYTYIKVILTLNYQRLFYDPTLQDKLTMSLDTLTNHMQGSIVTLGHNVIHKAYYPREDGDIQFRLMDLLSKPKLTCDIETFSLSLDKAGIGTISFAWSKHEGMAFSVDYTIACSSSTLEHVMGMRINNKETREILKIFFEQYKGTLIYHNATFDIKHIIYNVFMEHPQDDIGLLHGLDVMCKNVEDTKIITYLATNSTAGNSLSLKQNAFEFLGNYAEEDIKNIRLIPEKDLLEYNLKDCLATWFVYNKHKPTLLRDSQENVYNAIFMPSIKVVVHMELIGMPMDYAHTLRVSQNISSIIELEETKLVTSKLIADFEWVQQRENMVLANLLLKRKIKSIDEFKEKFNYSSNKQLRALLYTEFDLPVIDKTDSGLPACGGKTLKKLLTELTTKHNITEEELQ